MRQIHGVRVFAVMVFLVLSAFLHVSTGYAREKAQKGTGKFIQFGSEPESVRVYNAGSCVGTTPFTYEFTSLYEVDPEFVFEKCGYAVHLYQIPKPDPLEHNIISTTVGLWFQGKKYFAVHTGPKEKPGTMLLATSKVNVRLERLQERGVQLVAAISQGDEAARADARHVLSLMFPLQGCSEQQAFLRGTGVAHVLLRDSDANFRKLAAHALDRAGWSPPDSNEYYYYLLASRDWEKLKLTQGRAVEPLMMGLRDDDSAVREASLRVLTAIGRPVVGRLCQSLADKRERAETRRSCADALGVIGDPVAVEPLGTALRGDPDVRYAAALALAELGSTARGVLLEALVNADPDVRVAVLSPLGTLGRKDEETVEGLARLLRGSKTGTDRVCAAVALAEVGPSAEKAVPVLIDVFPVTSGTTGINVEVKGSLSDFEVNDLVGKLVNEALSAQFGEPCLEYVTVSMGNVATSQYHSSIAGIDQGVSTAVNGTAAWTLKAGACALSRITGEGWTTKDEWRAWDQSPQTQFGARTEPADQDVKLSIDGTKVSFILPVRTRVTLDLSDKDGKLVRTLVDRDLPPGTHLFAWDGRDASGSRVSGGNYSCRLSAGNVVSTGMIEFSQKIARYVDYHTADGKGWKIPVSFVRLNPDKLSKGQFGSSNVTLFVMSKKVKNCMAEGTTEVFRLRDKIFLLQGFDWDSVQINGPHGFKTEFYTGDSLVATDSPQTYDLLRPPLCITTSIQASRLGVGKHSVKAVVDDVVVAQKQFEIVKD